MAAQCFYLFLSLRWLLISPFFSSWANAQSITIPSIASYLSSTSTHGILIAALERADLFTELSDTNVAATMFAPTDPSFKALGSPFTLYLDQDPWIYHLFALLSFHMLSEVLSTASIFDGRRSNLTTLAPGLDMPVDQVTRTLDDGASIVTSDIMVSNGMVQVPDRVLIPPFMNTTLEDLVVSGELTNLERTFGCANFTNMVSFGEAQDLFYGIDPGGLTVLVPIDDAFVNDQSGLTKQLFAPGNENITLVIVQYHTAPYNLFVERISAMVPPQLPVQMTNGVTAWFTLNSNRFQVNGANFVVANDLRSNG
jgi:uncharacterized surface protein with fasciclin (FAS1) repeats